MYSPEVLGLITSLEQKECDDCGKKEVEWASVKKGTVICSECFCFHSYLGPSVSLVRNLRKSAWDVEQIRLVHALNSSNTNMIWESSLFDGTSKVKKPEPHDPTHMKEQFVREKYEKLAFQPKRGKNEDSDSNSLNTQLIACARSDFAHVTLRLIALGADVNYVDTETGDTALHVAAREGNSNQVELLFLYGADILAQNKDGQLPHMVAKFAGFDNLSQRIYEFFWYLFDKFTFFLCSRKADHKNNQDFFIPEVTEKLLLERTKASRSAISQLSKMSFFDICEDVYDEIIRRENEKIWSTTRWFNSSKGTSTLFLPPSHQMSAARNQRRQKLAKFTPIQFTILLIDLLKEQKRRVSGEPVPVANPAKTRQSVERSSPLTTAKKIDIGDYDEVAGVHLSPVSNITRVVQSIELNQDANSVVWDEVLEMKERLDKTEKLLLVFAKQNEELTKLVNSMKAQTINTNSEIISLREEIARLNRQQLTRRMPSPLAAAGEQPERSVSVIGGSAQSNYRRDSDDRYEIVGGTPTSGGGGARWRSNSSDRRNSNDQKSEQRKMEKRVEATETQISTSSNHSRVSRNASFSRDEFTGVIQQGENVTKAIRVLLQHGHNGNLDPNASHCALEISCSISTLISMLPSYVTRDKVNVLVDSVVMLNAKCNSPQPLPMDIIDAAQSVADKLRNVLLDV